MSGEGHAIPHDPEGTARAIAHFEQAMRTGERPGEYGAIELALGALYILRDMQLTAAGRRVGARQRPELTGRPARAKLIADMQARQRERYRDLEQLRMMMHERVALCGDAMTSDARWVALAASFELTQRAIDGLKRAVLELEAIGEAPSDE